jgi:hypothetical protein
VKTGAVKLLNTLGIAPKLRQNRFKYRSTSASLTQGGQSSVAATLLNQMFLSSNCARMRAIAEADILLLTVPNQLGVAYNVHLMEAILMTVAPGLGWR